VCAIGIDEVRPGSDAAWLRVSPVLSDGRVVALVPKLSRSRWEPDLVRGESWSPVTVASSCGEVTLAVLVCLDFLHREGPSGALVNDAIDEAAVLAVPRHTPVGSDQRLRSEDQARAERYWRPVPIVTEFLAGIRRSSPMMWPVSLRRSPDRSAGVADEGVIVADGTPVAPGRRPSRRRSDGPVASAPLVYTALR
jgi:hypothetical protein